MGSAMSETLPTPTTPRVREHHTKWWKEVLVIGTFYFLYTLT